MTAFLLDWAIRSTILLALGLAGYALLRRRSAAATHTVLAVTLIGAALLPAIRPLVPAWRMPLGFAARELPPPAAQAPVDLKPDRATAPLLPALESVPDLPTQQVAPVVPPARPFPWIPTLAIGVPLLLVMRRVLALLWMFSQARRGRSSQKLDEAVGAGCARLNLRRPARARLFDQAACPTAMTWGHFRPIVAMPLPSENWPEGRLAGVVLHNWRTPSAAIGWSSKRPGWRPQLCGFIRSPGRLIAAYDRPPSARRTSSSSRRESSLPPTLSTCSRASEHALFEDRHSHLRE